MLRKWRTLFIALGVNSSAGDAWHNLRPKPASLFHCPTGRILIRSTSQLPFCPAHTGSGLFAEMPITPRTTAVEIQVKRLI